MAETERKEGRPSSARPWQSVNPFEAMREVADRVLDTVLEPIGADDALRSTDTGEEVRADRRCDRRGR